MTPERLKEIEEIFNNLPAAPGYWQASGNDEDGWDVYAGSHPVCNLFSLDTGECGCENVTDMCTDGAPHDEFAFFIVNAPQIIKELLEAVKTDQPAKE